jgi:hypothetical protein
MYLKNFHLFSKGDESVPECLNRLFGTASYTMKTNIYLFKRIFNIIRELYLS